MFTSRAEYRLLLREDNADLRLAHLGHRIGLASDKSYKRYCHKQEQINELMALLEQTQLIPSGEINSKLTEIGSTQLSNSMSLAQILRRPEISISHIVRLVPEVGRFKNDVCAQVEIQTKYAGYVERQEEMVKRFRKMENIHLPKDLNYSKVKGLSAEVREKLTKIKPTSLGQASRIVGITPAAVSTLSIYLRKMKAVSASGKSVD